MTQQCKSRGASKLPEADGGRRWRRESRGAAVVLLQSCGRVSQVVVAMSEMGKALGMSGSSYPGLPKVNTTSRRGQPIQHLLQSRWGDLTQHYFVQAAWVVIRSDTPRAYNLHPSMLGVMRASVASVSQPSRQT